MENAGFELAASSSKEIMAFSTAILTATATFAKDTFLKERTKPPRALGISWVLYLLSVLFGSWTLLALTGELGSPPAERNINDFNVVFPARLMVLTFLAGLCCTAVAGWEAVNRIVEVNASAGQQSEEDSGI